MPKCVNDQNSAQKMPNFKPRNFEANFQLCWRPVYSSNGPGMRLGFDEIGTTSHGAFFAPPCLKLPVPERQASQDGRTKANPKRSKKHNMYKNNNCWLGRPLANFTPKSLRSTPPEILRSISRQPFLRAHSPLHLDLVRSWLTGWLKGFCLAESCWSIFECVS